MSYEFHIEISSGEKATRFAWKTAREQAHRMMADKARKIGGTLKVTNQRFERDEEGKFALGRIEYSIDVRFDPMHAERSYYTVRINREKRQTKASAERELLIECRDVLSAAGGKSKLIEKIDKYLDACK